MALTTSLLRSGGYPPGGVLRGIAAIGLGTTVFEFNEWIKNFFENKISQRQKIIFTLLKYFCWSLIIGYDMGILLKKGDYDIHAELILIIGIVLTLSNITYCIGGNWMILYLGKLAFPLYMTHGIVISVVKFHFGDTVSNGILVAGYAASIIFAIILKETVDYIIPVIRKVRNKEGA